MHTLIQLKEKGSWMGLLNLDARGKRILNISDLHCPAHHPQTRKFLLELKRLFKPQIVIIGGDETNGEAISFHDKDPDLLSPGDELLAAIESLQADVYSVFPNAYVLESNHGSLLFRKMKKHGIPIRALKPLAEIYGTPRWTWVPELVTRTKLGSVYYTHGMSSVPLKLAMARGMSTSQFHFHGEQRIMWKAFSSERKVFDMISGCMIDPSHDAFNYGKLHIQKPLVGCSGIHANGLPELFPMI